MVKWLATARKLKRVVPPSYPRFQKFWYLGRIKKKKILTKETNIKTTPQLEMQLPVQSGSRRWMVPAPWNEQLLEERSILLFSHLVFNSWPHSKMGTIQPKLGHCDCATRGGLTRSAAGPQRTTFHQLGRVDLGLPTRHHKLLRSGDLHPFNTALQANLAKTASQLWKLLKERQAFLRLTSYKQAASLLPAVHPWPPCPSCASSPPSVPVQTLTLSRPAWEWWRVRSRNRSCWKLTFFKFFFFRDYF